LRLHPRPFRAIRDGRKTVEVRADKNPAGPQAIGTLAAGDALVFTNTQTGETLACRVQRVTHYRDVRALSTRRASRETRTNNTLAASEHRLTWRRFTMSSLRVARKQVRLSRSHDAEDKASTLPPEELLASVWELTEEIYSLTGAYDAQSRLQRNVVVVHRRGR
jgi:ASC-1-like (ASCH) protein